uniref:CMP/dCMP-type deaminase domain-containing protein n=1 Tax=Panagrolaimus davidi TaxID=227884 RepID=A0A914PSA1_9BILA
MLLDAIKRDTTNALTRFMRNGGENYKYAIELISHSKSVELRRENFSVFINGQKFTIAYNFIFLKATLKAVGNSMRELVIVECPCACCLDSVLFHIIRGEKELRKIIILDNIPEKHESWIRRHTDAKICFPTSKLSVSSLFLLFISYILPF